jgi:hypothetical protein
VDDRRCRRRARAPSSGADLLLPEDLLQHRPVERDEHQPVSGVVGQLETAVAAHRVDDVDEQRLRHGVAGVADERVDDLLRVVPGRAGVPQRERGDPVGVHVLGRALQLGERRDRDAGGRGVGVVDLEQERLVGLDDEWSIGHGGCASGRTGM